VTFCTSFPRPANFPNSALVLSVRPASKVAFVISSYILYSTYNELGLSPSCNRFWYLNHLDKLEWIDSS
jgi:hypothetical protein